jgi:hypothetical protein
MMRTGQKWRCVNPGCRAEMVIIESSQLVGAGQPRCGCGTVMKRAYEKPTARRIVLGADKALGAAAGKESAKG